MKWRVALEKMYMDYTFHRLAFIHYASGQEYVINNVN